MFNSKQIKALQVSVERLQEERNELRKYKEEKEKRVPLFKSGDLVSHKLDDRIMVILSPCIYYGASYGFGNYSKDIFDGEYNVKYLEEGKYKIECFKEEELEPVFDEECVCDGCRKEMDEEDVCEGCEINDYLNQVEARLNLLEDNVTIKSNGK